MSTSPVPNQWCVVLGTPGTDPLTIVGGFATEAEAIAHQQRHALEHPSIPATVDVLVDPANC